MMRVGFAHDLSPPRAKYVVPLTAPPPAGLSPKRRRLDLRVRRALAAVTGGAAGAVASLLLGGSATTALPMVLFALVGAGALALRIRETAFERAQRALDDIESRLQSVHDPDARAVLLRQYATLLAAMDAPASALPATSTDGMTDHPTSNMLAP